MSTISILCFLCANVDSSFCAIHYSISGSTQTRSAQRRTALGKSKQWFLEGELFSDYLEVRECNMVQERRIVAAYEN